MAFTIKSGGEQGTINTINQGEVPGRVTNRGAASTINQGVTRSKPMGNIIKAAGSNKLIVAALDIGTAFSGYAYSFSHDFDSNPLKIQTNNWNGGGHISLKAPTCVLFGPGGVFHSFGYEAEDRYTELAEDGGLRHQDWFYFRRFKMMLHNNQSLSRDTPIHDEHNKPMAARIVFSAAIRYLKQHLLTTLQNNATGIVDTDVDWVLTVPAIWNESAKQFMREAAVEAGIPNANLVLALEPEAASVFCKRLPVEHIKVAHPAHLEAFRAGTCYMVLDLGGGTVHITVHEVKANGNLSEITKASGGPWGGMQVDGAFINILEDIFGEELFTEFREDNTADFLDLMRDFEALKRKISTSTTGKVMLQLPVSLPFHFTARTGKELNNHLPTTSYSGKITFQCHRMYMAADLVKELFTKSISNTISHVSGILAKKEYRSIDTMLLVGGFAESEIVQERIRVAFSNRKIIVPHETELVVLKGAVTYGHHPYIVETRVSKYTYGVERIDRFIPGRHSAEYKIYDHTVGAYKCKHIFNAFVHVGDDIPVDKVVTKRFMSDIYDCTEGFGVFASSSITPKYTVERGCFKLGNIKLQEAGHIVDVELKFGGTEFAVVVTDRNTGRVTRGCFDFLTH